MNEHELAASLRAIHVDRSQASGADAFRWQLLGIPLDEIPRRRAWTRPITRGRPALTFGALQLVAAGSISVLIGSLIVVGPLTPQPVQDPFGAAIESAPSTAATVGPQETDGGAIDWDSPFISLTADSMEARIGNETFTAAERPVWIESDYNGIWPAECPEHARAYDDCAWWQTTEPDPDPYVSLFLQVRWFEKRTSHHLWAVLLADESEWFAQQVNYRRTTRDGRGHEEFHWSGPLFTTPLGEPFRGDVVLSDPDWVSGSTARQRERHGLPGDRAGTATLAFENLMIDAYRPETLPAVRKDCQPLTSRGPDPDPVNRDFFAEGEPLHGHEDILEMTPAEAKVLLDELGYCYRFSARVKPDAWEPASDAERAFGAGPTYQDWCSAPPHGRIQRIRELSVRVPDHPYEAGAIGVQVIDETPRPRQEQPPAGFDCPTAADQGQSPSS